MRLTNQTISDVFLKNRILAAVQPDAKAFFAERAELRQMEFGDVVFENDASVTHVVFPHDGVVSIIAEREGGRSVEMSSIGSEGMLGFTVIMGGGPSLGRSVVQIAGKASWVSVSDLDVALERFHCVRDIMLRYAKSRIAQLMESVACNSLHAAEQRICRWLLHAHDRMGGHSFYLTQESIARLLALRRATVNAVCNDLMESGVISYQRGHVTVTNRHALHERSCECYDRIERAALPRTA